MRTIFLFIILSFVGNMAYAQSSSLSKKEERKLLREEKKKAAEEEAARLFKLSEELLNNKTFVLEAESLTNKYGQLIMVESSINFILVDSLYGIVQIGITDGLGENGVGGQTVEGKIYDYIVDKNEKRNTLTVRYTVKASVGSLDVTLFVNNGGRAEASVSGSFTSAVRFSGKLIHPAESRVFKGTSY